MVKNYKLQITGIEIQYSSSWTYLHISDLGLDSPSKAKWLPN